MKHIILGFCAFALTACSAQTSAPTKSTEKSTVQTIGAYMIVMGKDYNPADLGPYAASLPPIYKKYGGRYVAFTTDYNVVEGMVDAQAVIISAWPSAQAAQNFWDSPEYREAIKLREGIGTFNVMIVPALPASMSEK